VADGAPVDGAGVDALEVIASAVAVQALRGEERRAAERLSLLRRITSGTTASQELTTAMLGEVWTGLAVGDLSAVLATEAPQTDPYQLLLIERCRAHAAIWQHDLGVARDVRDRVAASGILGRWATALRNVLEAGIQALEGRPDDAASTLRDAIEQLRAAGATFDVALAHMDRVAVAADMASAERAAADARPILAQLRAVALERRLEELLAGAHQRAGSPSARVPTG
jgi:hypothetical protein